MTEKKKGRFIAAVITALLLTAFLCGCENPAPEKADEAEETEMAVEADDYYARLESCRDQIKKIYDFEPEVVVVLGTGMGDYVDSLDVKAVIPYADIEGWPNSTAPNHAGNLVFAEKNGVKVAVMQGRIHYYEGYSMAEVVLPVRVLHMLGADTVIFTNAVGSLNEEFRVGEFVCVKDQITSFVPSPLIGENIEELGPRFAGMTGVFDQDMQDTVRRIGEEKGIPVHSGVYLQVTGPQYETPAEIEMYRSLGADTVGMSTGVEVIAAAHMGMKVCAINCISNMAAGMEEEGFTHESVKDNMLASKKNLEALIDGLLDSLAE